MRKRKPAGPAATRSNRSRPESSAPAYHPATGQVLSEVEGGSPYFPKRPRQRKKVKK